MPIVSKPWLSCCTFLLMWSPQSPLETYTQMLFSRSFQFLFSMWFWTSSMTLYPYTDTLRGLLTTLFTSKQLMCAGFSGSNLVHLSLENIYLNDSSKGQTDLSVPFSLKSPPVNFGIMNIRFQNIHVTYWHFVLGRVPMWTWEKKESTCHLLWLFGEESLYTYTHTF